jgi:kinesin family member 11
MLPDLECTKRYTMSGDLTPTLGTFSPEAGVIPRTLHRLFHILETDHADFAVRVSFVELYNEELRDLNTPGDSIPMTSDTNGGGLKIFDETTSTGRNVVIQGVEETPIASAADGVRVLTRGSQRRQIAATRFNEHSSRSHSIFSITVHIKEIGSKGEDLLKVGKMNLVDLAGSENVGRSGAEKGRAREAGMINQSLLTLGRVINGLVDRSPHIPYRSVGSFLRGPARVGLRLTPLRGTIGARESKLTRLLQDSLGGRTKTCIIATVSPARSNLEETLSTLDYAARAKTIRNRPELNQRMTKGALLSQYAQEIERLKADLLVGVSFFSLPPPPKKKIPQLRGDRMRFSGGEGEEWHLSIARVVGRIVDRAH